MRKINFKFFACFIIVFIVYHPAFASDLEVDSTTVISSTNEMVGTEVAHELTSDHFGDAACLDSKDKLPSYFEITFIDVGQADAAFIICDGFTMMIDGGNIDDSQLIFSFLNMKQNDHIDYLIGTHAHEDHIGGLPAVLAHSRVDHVYCSTVDYDSVAFSNLKSQCEKQDIEIEVPNAGEVFQLGSATVTILASNNDLSVNNNSIILKIEYGNTSFLFMGDAERDEEQILLDNDLNLSATLLKVGHHGSNSSTSYQFLWHVMPQYSIISVGRDNPYLHPNEEVISRLQDAETFVYRTDQCGDIVCFSDGETLTFTVEKNEEYENDLAKERESRFDNRVLEYDYESLENVDLFVDFEECTYVINRKSLAFHYPSCDSVFQMNNRNKLFFNGAREDALSLGYHPCGGCNP